MSINGKTVILFCGLVMSGMHWGCSGNPLGCQIPKATVRGRVTVDGDVPKSPITIMCHAKTPVRDSDIAGLSAKTREDGSFEFISEITGAGLPDGKYVLTFTQCPFDSIKRKDKGPDLLNDRYKSPKESAFAFSVSRISLDLGTIELTTK